MFRKVSQEQEQFTTILVDRDARSKSSPLSILERTVGVQKE